MVSMFYADTLPCYATGQLDVCLVTQMQCGDRELPDKLIEHDKAAWFGNRAMEHRLAKLGWYYQKAMYVVHNLPLW